MKIRKIPIEDLLDVLDYIYELGVDYVDISGVNNPDQDDVFISFLKEYVNEKYIANFADDEDVPVEINLNKDNLNDLT